MGKVTRHPPVKLIVGLICANNDLFGKCQSMLKKKFGGLDFESSELAFDFTGYYDKEFGKCLKRKFISFKRLIPAEKLSSIKLFTNSLEKKLSVKGLRGINIDPGYLDMAKLVLASTKDFRHRIYIGRGMFAEITLYFQGKSFRSWEWTYPDYRTPEYIEIFNKIRELYRKQVN